MHFSRLFTQASSDPYGLISFHEPELFGDRWDVPMEHPDGWSVSAVELFAEQAALSALPVPQNPVEENTVPSWLWRHARAKNVGRVEKAVQVVFDRVVGHATYQGWKQKMFRNEEQARIFFDEARYVLAQRLIAFEPSYLGGVGADWAYGVTPQPSTRQPQSQPAVGISNVMIDALVSGRRDRALLNTWQKIIGNRNRASILTVHFTDTEAQWEAPAHHVVAASINLMAFRHNDGSVNIEVLKHVVRLAVLMADLNAVAPAVDVAIGYTNLAPLLMALALPYDSEAGRATAAAISGIITAEAYGVSAELAALRGAAPEFAAKRENCLRALRNHRRAAYGEYNDYEKMPVTPLPLAVASCPDLALTAAVRSGWDQALQQVKTKGLRHMQVTGLQASAALTLFMESDSDGIAPMRTLTLSEHVLHASVSEALARLGYDSKTHQAMTRRVAGALTLEKAPRINHVSLRARGFTAEILEKIEAYLPQAQTVRYAITPWVVGIDFCRKVLKIPAAKLDDMSFNLLVHLGFSADDIVKVDRWCYGGGHFEASQHVRPSHVAVFATAASLYVEAPIRMAAAVQGFVSGATDLNLHLPVGLAVEHLEKMLLDAWRRGVKSLSVTFDPALNAETQPLAVQAVLRRSDKRSPPSLYAHAKAPSLPKRQSRSSPARLTMAPAGRNRIRSATKDH